MGVCVAPSIRLAFLAFSLIWSLALPRVASAIAERLSIEDMTGRADLVAVLHIEKIVQGNASDLAVTVEALPSEWIKGRSLGCWERVSIREGTGISVAAEYHSGETVVAFLRRIEGCLFSTVGGEQGALVVRAKRVSGTHLESIDLDRVIERIQAALRERRDDPQRRFE